MNKNKNNKKKWLRRIILPVLFACICNLSAQENKLFKEYISCFTEIHLTDDFQNCDSIEQNTFRPEKFLCFLEKDVYKSWVAANSWFVYKVNKYYFVTIKYSTEDEKVFKNNGGYYYFVIYDDAGKIVNSYKLLAGTDQQWFKDGVNNDSKLFISKNKIRYLLYGPYVVPEMEANCKEVIYAIKENGSLEKLSECNYKAKKKDPWHW